MKSLVVATIITLLVAGTQVWAQLNHEYVPSEYDASTDVIVVVQRFMEKTGFSDKWWILERVQVDPEGIVAFIMIEGKHRYALFIIDEHIVGVQKLKFEGSGVGCSSP